MLFTPEARSSSRLGYLVVGVITVVFSGLFARILLSAPAYYPAIDQRHFFFLAHVTHALLAGEPHAWLPFRESLPSQYNALFALPLAPAFAIFGESYFVYGMSVSLIYGALAALAVGGVAAFILNDQGRWTMFAAFAATTACTITRSAAWFSTRNDYPDIGDALVLGLWFMVAISLLRKPCWQWMMALVAITLVVILFRRHLLFAWGAAGIGLAASVVASFAVNRFGGGRGGDPKMQALLIRLGFLAVSAIAALGVLSLIMPSFVHAMVSIAGADAYTDYERNPHDVLVALLGVVGIIPLVLSTTGYVAAALVFPAGRPEIIGIFLGGILHVLFWTVALRQIGPQYYVVPGALFLPIGVGLGTAALARLTQVWQRAVALVGVSVVLGMSAVRLVYAAAGGAEGPLVPHMWQASIAPLSLHQGMRKPFLEMFSRIGHMGRPVRVFVVASSRLLNEGIAQSASEALLGSQASNYFFPWVPAVDARDRLPLTELLQADVVLIVRPPQSDLPTGFDGLHCVLDMFANHDLVARDFQPVGAPIVFPKFSMTIYRRMRQSDIETAVAGLKELKAAVTRRGFSQPAWVEIGPPSVSGVVEYWGNDAVVAHDRDQRNGWPARFLSYDLVSKPVDLTGDGKTTCPDGAILTLRVADKEQPVPFTTVRLSSGMRSQAFLLRMAAPMATSHLELKVDAPNSYMPCDVTLRHMELKTRVEIPVSGGS